MIETTINARKKLSKQKHSRMLHFPLSSYFCNTFIKCSDFGTDNIRGYDVVVVSLWYGINRFGCRN